MAQSLTSVQYNIHCSDAHPVSIPDCQKQFSAAGLLPIQGVQFSIGDYKGKWRLWTGPGISELLSATTGPLLSLPVQMILPVNLRSLT